MLDDSGDDPGCPIASALQALQDIFIGPDHVEDELIHCNGVGRVDNLAWRRRGGEEGEEGA